MKKIHKIYGALLIAAVAAVFSFYFLKSGEVKSPDAPSSSPPKASHKTSIV